MKQSFKSLILAVMMGAITAAFTAQPTEATVRSKGHHRACRAYVAIRTKPGDSTARDNLEKGQTFVVTDGVGGHYVYGYKLVNGVHGWVLSSSIDQACR
jgi:hypothetical protein